MLTTYKQNIIKEISRHIKSSNDSQLHIFWELRKLTITELDLLKHYIITNTINIEEIKERS